jgi:hypothetical protein
MGKSVQKLADEYGVCRMNVWNIVNEVSWKGTRPFESGDILATALAPKEDT